MYLLLKASCYDTLRECRYSPTYS